MINQSLRDWKKKQQVDNPWDAEIIKPPYTRPIYVRHTAKRLQGVQNPLNRLAKNNALLLKTTIESSPVWHQDHILKSLAKHPSPLLGQAVYHNLLYRAKQLAYLQPIFDLFLDPPCKGLVYLSTIGQKYWVIATTDAHAKANFNSNQMTFRLAFEGYLKLKSPNFVLPQFKVIHYRFFAPKSLENLEPVHQELSETALSAMRELKAILQSPHMADIVTLLPKTLSQIEKPFLFKNYPKSAGFFDLKPLDYVQNSELPINLQKNYLDKINQILKKTKVDPIESLVKETFESEVVPPTIKFSFKAYQHLYESQNDAPEKSPFYLPHTIKVPPALSDAQKDTMALINAMIRKPT